MPSPLPDPLSQRARISYITSSVQTVFAYLQEQGTHFLTAPSESK